MANRTYHPRGTPVHGYVPAKHPLYNTWAHMLSRCYNPDNPNYPNYGGRGIAIEDTRWHHFANFAHDMGIKPDPVLTLERVNNMRGYCADNCEWATRSDQCVNRRTFKNNTTGTTGVVPMRSGFEVRFDYEKQRYRIGRYDTVEEAAAVREAFIGLFFRDRSAALDMIEPEPVWRTSTTGIRGVTRHEDGGFIVRTTVNKERVYLGYRKTLEEAAALIAPYRKKKAPA